MTDLLYLDLPAASAATLLLHVPHQSLKFLIIYLSISSFFSGEFTSTVYSTGEGLVYGLAWTREVSKQASEDDKEENADAVEQTQQLMISPPSSYRTCPLPPGHVTQ